MLKEEIVDREAWSLVELGELEATARGFIAGVLTSTPFDARARIKMKLEVRKGISIHVSNMRDPGTMWAFAYHVVGDGAYSDEVFLCEIETYSIDHDRFGLEFR